MKTKEQLAEEYITALLNEILAYKICLASQIDKGFCYLDKIHQSARVSSDARKVYQYKKQEEMLN